MHAKRVLAPAPAAAIVDADLAPPPMLTASVPYAPDEAGIDPPTPYVGKVPETPQAGKDEQSASGATSSAPMKVIAAGSFCRNSSRFTFCNLAGHG